MAIEPTELLSVRQAAAALGVHEKTIWRRLRKKKMTRVLIGGRSFIPQSEIDRLNNERKMNEAQGLPEPRC